MKTKRLSGIFINCIEAQDSIYESGKMAFQSLLDSDKYSLDYIEFTPDNTKLSTGYDFYFFNYHPITMSWLDTKSIKDLLPGVKMTLVLEVSPNDPFVFCSPDDFDAYIVLDPTLNIATENVFAFPRPLETFNENIEYEPKEIPVIGSFGFATSGKGFEIVIDAVNREFEKAIVRINIPHSSYGDKSGQYAKELGQICQDKAKKGIEVLISHDFMTKSDLIKWCSQNTLNCFLYDRNMPGLAATTDQAISSGRPLITSKNTTFRHIQKYIKPFPYQTLTEAIENTEKCVNEIQQDWSAGKFREKFENVLDNFSFEERQESQNTVELLLIQPEKPTLTGIVQKIKGSVAIRTRINNLKNSGTIKRKIKQNNPPVVSYSQFGEDIIINDLLTAIPIKSFSYLDIGANNPKFISNTYLFYEQGFRGVLVEPNPFLCGKLNLVRPEDKVLNFGIGIDSNVKDADFYLFPDEADGLSTFSFEEANHWETVGLNGKKYKIERIWKMPLVDINEVISNYFTECPDFISIDVEGWDLQILKTLDFEKYNPAVFCVETLAYREDGSTYRLTEINDFFETNGYFSFEQTYANDIFVNKKLFEFYQYQKNQGFRK